MNNYEEKKQARIDRYHERARNAERNSTALHDEAHKMASVIPFGQPILVGHHSEKRDRNYRNRIHNKFGKAFEEGNKASHYAEKAAAAENNTAISSDDPTACDQLKAKIEKAEKDQELMKAANKIIKSKKRTKEEKVSKLQGIGFPLSNSLALFEVDFCGRIGFPPYRITNNNANIRRMKERLEHLERQAGDETTETEINGVSICDNVEENRVQLFFNGKPSEEIRTFLKRAGFRWSRYNMAWQRHRSAVAMRYAKEAAAL